MSVLEYHLSWESLPWNRDVSLRAGLSLPSTDRIGKRPHIYTRGLPGSHKTHYTVGQGDLVTLSLPHAYEGGLQRL